jgi:hypothetical protein
LILAVASLGFIFFGQAPSLASCFPLVPVLLSVSLTQTWWARWAPQGWLIPLCFLIPVLSCLKNAPAGRVWGLPFLALTAGLLNSIAILAFYTVGCVKAQRVLKSQLAFVKTLSQPLAVFMPRFKSNRTWLIREKVEFVLADNPPSKPFIRLMRTETLIPLPTKWEDNLGNAPMVAEWKKRRLIEE